MMLLRKQPTIRWRDDRQCLVADLRVKDDETGKTHRRRLAYPGRETEVSKAVQRWAAEQLELFVSDVQRRSSDQDAWAASGSGIDPRMKLDRFFHDLYLPSQATRATGTRRWKRGSWSRHLSGWIGNLPVSSLANQATADRVTAKLAGGPLEISTRNDQVLALFSSMVTCAQRYKLISERPKIERFKKTAAGKRSKRLGPERAVRLREIIQPMPVRRRVLIKLGLHCGLRVGEAGALKLFDVNWRKKEMRLAWHLAHAEETGSKREELKRGLKGALPERIVPLDDDLFTDLCELRKDARSEFVLSREPGKFRTTDEIRSEFKEITKLAFGKASGAYHALRHECFSSMADGGASIAAVKEIAGHTDIKETQEYFTASDASKRDAVAVAANPTAALRARIAMIAGDLSDDERAELLAELRKAQ